MDNKRRPRADVPQLQVPPFEVHIPKGIAWFMGLLAEWKTFIMGTPTTLSRGSVKDACSMRYASGEKARRILGYEARIGIEEGLQLSCLVSFMSGVTSKH
jgi:sterol-4alpha-carboxylate 3-dehydrogenase (decarboxylating)